MDTNIKSKSWSQIDTERIQISLRFLNFKKFLRMVKIIEFIETCYFFLIKSNQKSRPVKNQLKALENLRKILKLGEKHAFGH